MSEASAERLVKARYESAYQGGGIWIEGPAGVHQLGTTWRDALKTIQYYDKLARKNRRK